MLYSYFQIFVKLFIAIFYWTIYLYGKKVIFQAQVADLAHWD